MATTATLATIGPLEPLQLDADCCAPLGADALDQGSAEQLAQAFKALGDPVRLRLLSIIASAPAGEVLRMRPDRPVGQEVSRP